MLSWTAEGLEEPSVRLASIAMPESLLMFTVSVDWLLHAIAKRINTEIIYIFINITSYGVIPRLSNDILDRRIRPTAFFLDAAVALIYQLIPSSFFLCSPTYQFLHRYEFWTFLQPGSSLQISIAGRKGCP
jgi:hypothetical protein